MIVRLTQLDGKLPNLALMKLAHWHRTRGDEVYFFRSANRSAGEPTYDRVYGSAIFSFSAPAISRFSEDFSGAIIGGTGCCTGYTVEEIIGGEYEHYDYSDYPEYQPSLGFTSRGCRLKCKFCVVPLKEGSPRAVNTIAEIWRGGDHPKKIHLLDNDFFGQPAEQWRARVDEIVSGGYKVCFNQGINVRLIGPEQAAALAAVQYRDDEFQRRRLYTAWDNLKDEGVFFRGVDALERAGVPSKHLMAYMLVGWAKDETWERLLYRHSRMHAAGIRPYVMVYDRSRKDLLAFARWSNTGLYRAVPWSDYRDPRKTDATALREAA